MSGYVDASDLKELERAVKKLGKVPQRVATRAAGKGANIVRRSIKARAPVASGVLKKSIVREGERSRVKGKKVYQTTFAASMNDVLQKPIKNPGVAGGKSGHAYYPASMEHGFLTRSKGGGYDWVPGYHFMRQGAEEAAPAADKAMVDTAMAEIEKEWMRKHGSK